MKYFNKKIKIREILGPQLSTPTNIYVTNYDLLTVISKK